LTLQVNVEALFGSKKSLSVSLTLRTLLPIIEVMSRQAAFLRAINVGGRTVKMLQLRQIFEEMGLENVETFIASGNVIFDTRRNDYGALSDRIGRKLEQSLGFPVATFVRSLPQVAAIAAYEPFTAMPAGATVYIAFLPDTFDDKCRAKLLALQTETDRFHFHDQQLYWLCLTSFSDSAFSGAKLEKILGVQVTVRSLSTIRKLAAKYRS
jgi:uncharacterized protein (DUF1697 family)